jgi:hypothetical protein
MVKFRIQYSGGRWNVWVLEDELNQYDKISEFFIDNYTDEELRELTEPKRYTPYNYVYNDMVPFMNYSYKVPILRSEQLYSPYYRPLEYSEDTVSYNAPIKRKYVRKSTADSMKQKSKTKPCQTKPKIVKTKTKPSQTKAKTIKIKIRTTQSQTKTKRVKKIKLSQPLIIYPQSSTCL